MKLIALFLTSLAFSAFAQQENACLNTAENSLQSCNSEVESKRLLAVANCLNSADSATCNTEAQTGADAGLKLCTDQNIAQKALCEKLGAAPYDPQINPENFVKTVDNPYFPLIPGTRYVYEGQTEDGLERVEVTVTENTKEILGVTCIEVRDIVKVDDKIVEDTLDWFAQDKDGNVWYFGESSKEIEDEEIVSLEGSFVAGDEGAKPGIVMKANPAVGDVYRQEFALRVAEDVGEVLALDENVIGRTGTYQNVLKTQDTSPLEPTAVENKFYAKDVGLIQEIDTVTGEKLELVRIVKP